MLLDERCDFFFLARFHLLIIIGYSTLFLFAGCEPLKDILIEIPMIDLKPIFTADGKAEKTCRLPQVQLKLFESY